MTYPHTESSILPGSYIFNSLYTTFNIPILLHSNSEDNVMTWVFMEVYIEQEKSHYIQHEWFVYRVVSLPFQTNLGNLGLKRADFILIRDQLWTIPWKISFALQDCLRKQVDFRGLHSPSSRMFHPDKQKVKQKWQEAHIGEQGVFDQIQI